MNIRKLIPHYLLHLVKADFSRTVTSIEFGIHRRKPPCYITGSIKIFLILSASPHQMETSDNDIRHSGVSFLEFSKDIKDTVMSTAAHKDSLIAFGNDKALFVREVVCRKVLTDLTHKTLIS